MEGVAGSPLHLNTHAHTHTHTHTHTNSHTHMCASQVVSPLLGVVLKVARGDGKGKEMWSPQHMCDR